MSLPESKGADVEKSATETATSYTPTASNVSTLTWRQKFATEIKATFMTREGLIGDYVRYSRG